MRRYRFGSGTGRFVGNTEKFSVYEDVISIGPKPLEGKRYERAPGEFSFSYGPLTGGLLESVAFDFETPGELIKSVRVEPYSKVRTIAIKGLTPQDALLRVERINGFHAASHSIAYEMAVEDALGVEPPEGVLFSRIVMLELERIRSNLLVVKRLCEPAGFGVPMNEVYYLTEKVSRLISAVSGHRYFFSSTYVGGCDIKVENLATSIKGVAFEFEKIFDGLLQSKIFLNRLQNNGKTDHDSDLLGPSARAAGKRVDARDDADILPYKDLGFNPVLFDEPDAFGRFYVRSIEIIRSAEIIENAVNLCSNGPQRRGVTDSGEGAARVESPQGDLFYYVKIDRGVIEDVQISSPSLLNINAFKKSMVGNIFTDYHFNWESFGIWVSELAVVLT
ncbi:MAG: Ni,Fe-hydrogenase III large subunit [Thermoprotei archaeon]